MSDNLQKNPDHKYDAFIAHNSLDGDQVDELVQQLESRGVRVCYPARDFLAGRFVIENITKGIAESKKTITYLTKNFLASEWSKHERATAQQKAIKSKQHVLVDILVDIDNNHLPDWLQVTTYVERKSRYFFRSLLTALEVSRIEVRVEKSYDDLLKEIDCLSAEITTLHDDKQLVVKTWKKKEQSWLSEKQALISKLNQLELKQKQLEDDIGKKEEAKRRKQKPIVKKNESELNMDVDTSSVPAHWEPIPAGKTWREVYLPLYTEECQEVRERFWRTAGGLGGGIGRIHRIQNPSLYQAYQTKKYELSPDMREEYTLYYGTSGVGEYEQIRKRGFNGNNVNNSHSAGICFTSTSKAAIQNSGKSRYGWKYIIAAQALPGRCVQANMVTSGQGVPAGYDSVVDDVDNPSWVRIKDARFYINIFISDWFQDSF